MNSVPTKPTNNTQAPTACHINQNQQLPQNIHDNDHEFEQVEGFAQNQPTVVEDKTLTVRNAEIVEAIDDVDEEQHLGDFINNLTRTICNDVVKQTFLARFKDVFENKTELETKLKDVCYIMQDNLRQFYSLKSVTCQNDFGVQNYAQISFEKVVTKLSNNGTITKEEVEFISHILTQDDPTELVDYLISAMKGGNFEYRMPNNKAIDTTNRTTEYSKAILDTNAFKLLSKDSATVSTFSTNLRANLQAMAKDNALVKEYLILIALAFKWLPKLDAKIMFYIYLQESDQGLVDPIAYAGNDMPAENGRIHGLPIIIFLPNLCKNRSAYSIEDTKTILHEFGHILLYTFLFYGRVKDIKSSQLKQLNTWISPVVLPQFALNDQRNNAEKFFCSFVNGKPDCNVEQLNEVWTNLVETAQIAGVSIFGSTLFVNKYNDYMINCAAINAFKVTSQKNLFRLCHTLDIQPLKQVKMTEFCAGIQIDANNKNELKDKANGLKKALLKMYQEIENMQCDFTSIPQQLVGPYSLLCEVIRVILDKNKNNKNFVKKLQSFGATKLDLWNYSYDLVLNQCIMPNKKLYDNIKMPAGNIFELYCNMLDYKDSGKVTAAMTDYQLALNRFILDRIVSFSDQGLNRIISALNQIFVLK